MHCDKGYNINVNKVLQGTQNVKLRVVRCMCVCVYVYIYSVVLHYIICVYINEL
jgi:hypothetical protein